MKSDTPYLRHIADSLAAIRGYVAEGREAFMRERMIQDAVIRNFEIVGEAANRLSPELRDQSKADWRSIIAFRNRLIHGYWSIDLPLVWDVIEKQIPALEAEVATLLRGRAD